ncbi:MAG: Rrf2 family transcriptional regulator [Planctomycetota bacterium]
MRLSKRSEYGIKAIMQLAQRQSGGYLQSREIASTEDLPAKFLESILLALRNARMLESKVGAGGGYRLCRPIDSISLREVIDALEPDAQSTPTGNGHGADQPMNGNGQAHPTTPPSPGAQALAFINNQIDDALQKSIGSLSVAELMIKVEERPAARTPQPTGV